MGRRFAALIFVAIALAAPRPAPAAVTLLVSEGVGLAAEVHGGGHASVHLSNVCSDDGVTLRRCRPGEEGVVLSTYANLVPAGEYYWLAVPLSVYLYGVAAADDAPLYADRSVRTFLQRQYARRYLAHLVSETELGGRDGSRWSWPAVVGNVLDRTVYAFRLENTATQDARAMAVLNDLQHRGRFGLSRNNCSDFARVIINAYFPGAAHRDVLNDFAITTPKAVAESMTSFGREHDTLGFTIEKYRQIEGPSPRSLPNRSLTEKMVTSKKYLALTLATNPVVTAVAGVVYGLTRPFSFERALRASGPQSTDGGRPAPADRRMAASLSAAAWSPAAPPTGRSGRDARAAADRAVQDAIADGLFRDRDAVVRFAESLEATSESVLDAAGRLGLRVRLVEGSRVVGLTRTNVVATASDPTLAYQILLSTFVRAVNRSGAHRPTLDETAAHWALLQAARDRAIADGLRPAPLACAAAGDCSPPSQLPRWRRWLRKALR